jgi:hypothetical protein
MSKLLVLTLAIFMFGCGATTQLAQVQQTTKPQSRSCHLELTYNCPQPVIGQPYSCDPTVTKQCDTENALP